MSIFFICIFNGQYALAEDRISKERILGDDKTPWQITAKSLIFNEKESNYIAEGDVTLHKGDQTISAQEALYDRHTGIVRVTGNVSFESGEDFLTGESGVFDLNTQTGNITDGSLFLKQNHYYINGDVMEKVGENTYLIKNFRLTTCDGTSPAWSITGSEVRVTIEGYGKLKNAAFRVHGFPFLYVPYMIFPAKTKRQTGLLPPRLGYSNRNGAGIEVPFFWAISEQTDATFYERIMSRRGLMQGLEFRYVAENDSKGIYLFDILSDRTEEKDLNNPEHLLLSPFVRTNKTRYWLRSRTDQQFPLGLRACLDMDVVSDQDYLKEFQGGLYGYRARPDIAKESGRPIDEIQSPFRRSAFRLSRDLEEYSLQALTSYHQRPENPANDTTPQPRAGLDFAILPRLLPKVPLAFSLDTDYDYVWRDFGQKGHSISFSPKLSYPMWLGPYLGFEPSVSFIRNTQWLDDHPDIDRQSKDAYMIQARLSTFMERIFDLEWGKVQRMKHKISPSLLYEYRVPKDKDRYEPWFEPINMEGKNNKVTFSIGNILDAKKVDSKEYAPYFQLGTFSLSQRYDIDEAQRDEELWRKKEPFEPLKGILTFMPFQNLDLGAEAHWDHYDDDISFSDLSLELKVDRSGGRKDSYEIDYIYQKYWNRSLNFSLDVNLFPRFSAGSALKRDLNIDKNIENSYWVEYKSQCWEVQMTAAKQDDVSSIMLTLHLLGLGDIGG